MRGGVGERVAHFAKQNRLVLIPLLVVVTQGLSVVAPFVYALF